MTYIGILVDRTVTGSSLCVKLFEEGQPAASSKLGWLLSGTLDNVKENHDLLFSSLISFWAQSFRGSKHSDPG